MDGLFSEYPANTAMGVCLFNRIAGNQINVQSITG